MIMENKTSNVAPTDDDLVDCYEIDSTFKLTEQNAEDSDLELENEQDHTEGEAEVDEQGDSQIEDVSQSRKKRKIEALKVKKKEKEGVADGKDEQTLPSKKRKLFQVESASKEDLAAYFWTLFEKEKGKDLSPLEESLKIEGRHIFKGQSGRHSTKNFARFVRSLLPDWKRELKTVEKNEKGSATVVILCSSAIRATEVIKALAEFKVKIAKLFSKHLKVKDQVEMLSKPFLLAVGTPNRILKLADMGALQLENAKAVILDMKRDTKNYNLLELPDTRKDTMHLYYRYLMERVHKEKVIFSLY